jgi:hypothetical protein
MENCLKEKPEISKRAVHQDQPDQEEQDEPLDGDHRVEGLNTESISIKEQTVYFDIRLKAYLPGKDEVVQLIINLEIQLKDMPGYPLIKRGIYYCARMISEQYGTVFTKEEYSKINKVYSIWICPSPAQKRQNTISKYHMIKEDVYGRTDILPINYDLMEVVIINLGDVEKESELEILNLLNILFSPSMSPRKKKDILSNDFNIEMTQELESEVQNMCNLSDGIFELGRQEGRQEGERLGRQEGERLGRQEGENRVLSLIQQLLEVGRVDDVKRVANDKEYCNLLMKELKII